MRNIFEKGYLKVSLKTKRNTISKRMTIGREYTKRLELLARNPFPLLLIARKY